MCYNGGMNSEVSDILAAARELKMPLATLRQLALMLGEMSTDNERIRTEMVGVSERAIQQVNDLMRLSKLEDGLFEMEPVGVRAVCGEVTREIAELFNKGELMVEYRNRTSVVTANYELLASVVRGFLANAAASASDKVRLTVRDAGGKVEIAVRDRGPALPMEVWREIRKGRGAAQGPVAMRPGASRLALYTASRFSRYMHAEVGAVRHRDGTSFYVRLPRSEQRSFF